MKNRFLRVRFDLSRLLLFIALFCATAMVCANDSFRHARGERGAVATAHPLATDAALEVLREGGNAIDAAVTAGLTLGVVHGYSAGIGGGILVLVRLADGSVHAIDGRETAPAKAHPEMYFADGEPDGRLSRSGPLAVGTPGAVAAYAQTAERFGRLPFSRHLYPGIEYAGNGFEIGSAFEGRVRRSENLLKQYGARDILFDESGEPLSEGTILKQPDLARTYRMIAEEGVDWFYRGEFAETVGAWMEQNGGILREEDFAAYRAIEREPVRSTYRGYEVFGFPPPSSGGIHVAQILNILEHFDVGALRKNPADRVHLIAEAMKLAFADRAYWLGDADFARVPAGLIDREYAAELAARIDPEKTVEVPLHSFPPDWEERVFGRHTTHIAAVDAEGNWAAITATINTSFGSKVVVPGTGVFLNNEMDDFAIAPGVPNAYGLLGAEANQVEAGKRPLSAMSPTIVMKDGAPIFSAGAAGGPTIITQTLLAAIGVLDLDMSIFEALDQPRFHHQWMPDTLRIEDRHPEEVFEALEKRGHTLQRVNRIGTSQAVARNPDGTLEAASEPRSYGKAAAW